jgi:hypothetical protein
MSKSKELRQAELLTHFEFTCECTACVNDYPMPQKLKRTDKSFVLPKFGKFSANENLIGELQGCFKYMNDNIDRHPSFETAAVMLRTRELVREICERIQFPFK